MKNLLLVLFLLSSFAYSQTDCVATNGGLITVLDSNGVATAPQYSQPYKANAAAILLSQKEGKASIKTPEIVCTTKQSSSASSASSSAVQSSSPSSLWRKNEPAGMTGSERLFSSNSESPWWAAGPLPITLVTSNSQYDDAGGKAGRIIYKTGHKGGDDLDSATGLSFNGTYVYLTFDLQLSTNWQSHLTGTNKVFYITNSGGNPAFISYETEQDIPQIEIRNQGMAVGVPTDPNLAIVRYSPGDVVLVEVLLKSNSARGVADGEAHLWINGVKTTEYKNLQWNSSNFKFNQLIWNPIWGGLGGSTSAEMYQQISRIYASYK